MIVKLLKIRTFAATLVLGVALGVATAPAPASAQNLFEAMIVVNGVPITRYELQQREKLLTLLQAPADPRRLAREQLIEDRLKMQAAKSQGFSISEEALLVSMDRFASQGNLNAAEMIELLNKEGVSEQTFRDFIRSGVTWAELTQAKFGARVSVSEDDLERAKAAIGTGTGVRVLLSEIIIPFTPETKEQVDDVARRISLLKSTGAFSAEARKYSATPTRDQGGRLPWTPVNQLPPILRPIVLGLAPGDVTDPLRLQGAVALFQMRDIQELDVRAPSYAAIEYAAYYIDGGRSDAAFARARQIDADTDTCDDLYGIAQGQPENVLERGSRAPEDIPNDIAIELSRLDPGEVSYSLTRAEGQTLVLLMLCGRATTIEEETPVAAAETEDGTPEPTQTQVLLRQIGDQRLESYAGGYLAQLRSEARIVEK